MVWPGTLLLMLTPEEQSRYSPTFFIVGNWITQMSETKQTVLMVLNVHKHQGKKEFVWVRVRLMTHTVMSAITISLFYATEWHLLYPPICHHPLTMPIGTGTPAELPPPIPSQALQHTGFVWQMGDISQGRGGNGQHNSPPTCFASKPSLASSAPGRSYLSAGEQRQHSGAGSYPKKGQAMLPAWWVGYRRRIVNIVIASVPWMQIHCKLQYCCEVSTGLIC